MYKDMCKLPTVVQVLLSCVLPRYFLSECRGCCDTLPLTEALFMCSGYQDQTNNRHKLVSGSLVFVHKETWDHSYRL